MQSLKRRDQQGDEESSKKEAKCASVSKCLLRRRLYLIFDDWAWGYSIREIDLGVVTSLKPASSQKGVAASSNGAVLLQLPEAIIRFEAPRGYPLYFAAVGTRIVLTHPRNTWDDDSVPGGYMPFVDVSSRGVTFGPGQVIHDVPIYLPVKNMLFALDSTSVMVLSLKPLWPPRLENRDSSDNVWSWRKLRKPPFDRLDITAYMVCADCSTIMFSTTKGTFTLDLKKLVKGMNNEEDLEWTPLNTQYVLPFTGRGYYVASLDSVVGLSKDPATFGHLVSIDVNARKNVCQQKLFSQEPSETHAGATLIYMGDGTVDGNEFCLLECVSVELGNGDQKFKEYHYRLTTFSLSFDNNGDLTTFGTCQVHYLEVPKDTTERFLHADPVAFWL